MSNSSPSVTPTPSPTITTVSALLIPLVTIIGLIVLIALHDLTPAAGIGLIGALAGVHGGASVAINATK